MSIAHTISASTHGRYLIEPAAEGRPLGLLVGFHGYAEDAEAQLQRLQSVPGSSDWLLVSIQGLHRFYNRRSQDVVASWMTRQDRDLAIVDNLAFVNAVVDAVTRELRVEVPLVFAGFSQGVAMACRAACGCPRRLAGLITVGGDVPPELERAALSRIPAALVARGARDEWYSPEKWSADETRLREAGVAVRAFGFDGGHEWNAGVSAAAGAFLRSIMSTGR